MVGGENKNPGGIIHLTAVSQRGSTSCQAGPAILYHFDGCWGASLVNLRGGTACQADLAFLFLLHRQATAQVFSGRPRWRGVA